MESVLKAAFPLGKDNQHSSNDLLDYVSRSQWSEDFSDLSIKCSDGTVQCHRIVVAGMSPFMKRLLLDVPEEEHPIINLPDVTVAEIKCVLALLYRGEVNLYKSEIQKLVCLTQVIKLVSIPVAVCERAWSTRFPQEAGNVRSTNAETAEPTVSISTTDKLASDGKTKKRRTPKRPQAPLAKRAIPILSTQRTRSGRTVAHRKYAEDELVGDSVSHVEDYESGHASPAEDKDQSKHKTVMVGGESSSEPTTPTIDIASGGSPTNQSNDKTSSAPKETVVASVVVEPAPLQADQGESGQQLANLITVAEAFERTQQPDVHEIMNSSLEGTDTENLVRKCVLCEKRVLGRNALGRHMKNNHPAVLGPYKCPVADCTKKLESGEKVLKHMYSHQGRRAKAIAEGIKFVCCHKECNSKSYTTESRLNDHLRKRHGVAAGATEVKFACNLKEDHPTSKCRQEFVTAKSFINHMKNTHQTKPWICLQCPGKKRFQERQNFNFHMMSHEGRRGFICDFCQKSYANPRQLYSHRALHLGRRYLCTHCGFKARSTANLRGHIRTKHEDRSFQCLMCEKKFSTNNNLKNHMRIHTGETPYECELCNVKFKRVHHLHSHIESKAHMDVMQSCRTKGTPIPDRLDPVRRLRGRSQVEDTVLGTKPGGEVHEGAANSNVSGMIVVEEEDPNLSTYIIPLDGSTVEFIENR